MRSIEREGSLPILSGCEGCMPLDALIDLPLDSEERIALGPLLLLDPMQRVVLGLLFSLDSGEDC